MSNLYNIAAGANFAADLVRGIKQRASDESLTVSDITIFLPNRRSCRSVSNAFLNAEDGQATILPRLIPVGDVELEDLLPAGVETPIPPAISDIKRQFLLAQLIRAKPETEHLNSGQVLNLARHLGQFIDHVHTHNLDPSELKDLVPEELATHWQTTLQFLDIVTTVWPDILEQNGVIDRADYRNRAIDAKIESFEQIPPKHLTILAGATGAVPAVRRFAQALLKSENGVVILPGLDQTLDNESWQVIAPTHPQYSLKQLFQELEVERRDVTPWLEDEKVSPRLPLLSEVMRPAEQSDQWVNLTRNTPLREQIKQMTDGLHQINCDSRAQEASTISVILRWVIHNHPQTAILVTPDRDLASRVSVMMKRWGIDIDDSGGEPLSRRPVGRYLTQLLDACRDQNAISILTLMRNPLTGCGQKRSAVKRLAQDIEQKLFRGSRILNGFSGVEQAILQHPKLEPEEQQKLLEEYRSFYDHLKPITDLIESGNEQTMAQWAEAHIKTAELLATSQNQQGEEKSGAENLWIKDDGVEAAEMIGDLLHYAKETFEDDETISLADYCEAFEALSSTTIVRPKFSRHPRVQILSPTEARMQSADVVILGGLNEGVWPIGSQHDPWMSRQMRHEFGMPDIDHQIGLSAHDFSQLFCSGHVYLTQSARIDGSPMIPSRWLVRLETCLAALDDDVAQIREYDNQNSVLPSNSPFLQWAEKIDTIHQDRIPAAKRPEPTPPLQARPKKLSATNLATLKFDPYQIYAKYILRLSKDDDIAKPFDHSDWGNFIHDCMEDLTNEISVRKSADDLAGWFKQHCQDQFDLLQIPQSLRGYWRLQLNKTVEWIIDTLLNDLVVSDSVTAEIEGSHTLDLDNGSFTITGWPDALQIKTDEGLVITDYKTGYVPPSSKVNSMVAPQLPILGIIAQNGGFGETWQSDNITLRYIQLKDSSDGSSNGTIKPLENSAELIDQTEQSFRHLLNYFLDGDVPYRAKATPESYSDFSRFDDYKRLSRFDEWQEQDEQQALSDDSGEVAA